MKRITRRRRLREARRQRRLLNEMNNALRNTMEQIRSIDRLQPDAPDSTL